MVKYTCPNCSNLDAIPPSAGKCPACQRELPQPPNVRVANNLDEIKALNIRLGEAEAETKARGCIENLDSFGLSVDNASAAICRPIGEIQRLVVDNQLYNTFYNQLSGLSRLPEDSKFDGERLQADTLIFPHYHEKIVFSALTLNDQGSVSYGAHTVVLKDEAICHRASVFEQNTLVFCKNHNLSIGMDVLKGYRASWENKGKLAKAKLYSKISEDTQSEQYPDILLQNNLSGTDKDDFIEVHIYEGFSRGAIKKISFGKTNDRAETLLINVLIEKLKKLDIEAEKFQGQKVKAA